tara:strand:- start:347 stop:475 length:129 start_codon:yes stop_codon:yes gene_type:complete
MLADADPMLADADPMLADAGRCWPMLAEIPLAYINCIYTIRA